MSTAERATPVITAAMVQAEARIAVLPSFFPGIYGRVESAIYDWMRRMVPGYTGGYWEFCTLSNGGMFLYPRKTDGGTFHVEWYGNGFVGDLSPEATGLVMTLMAMSHLSFDIADERLSDNFCDVREYALQLPEAGQIFAVLD